jgi:hypothetical protein
MTNKKKWLNKQSKLETFNLKVTYKFTLEKQTHKTKSFMRGLNLPLNCPLQHKWLITQNNLIQLKRSQNQLPHYFKLESCINIKKPPKFSKLVNTKEVQFWSLISNYSILGQW